MPKRTVTKITVGKRNGKMQVTRKFKFKKTYNKRNKNGYAKIIRKVQPIFSQNSGVGTVQLYEQVLATGTVAPYTSDLVQFGTPAVGISGAYDVPFSIKFRLSDLVNSTELITIADKYRIKGAYVRIIPSSTEHLMSSIYSRTYIEYYTDHDDASPPSLAQLRERMGMKTKTFTNGRYVGIKCRPAVNSIIYKNATSTGNAPTWGKWLDNADNAVEHYGIKGVIRGYNLVNPTSLKSSFMFDIALVVELKDFQ